MGEKKEIGIAYMEKERSLVIGEKIEVRTMMVGTRGSEVTNGTRAFSDVALPSPPVDISPHSSFPKRVEKENDTRP